MINLNNRMCIYSKKEFLDVQDTWCDEDEFKNYEPKNDYLIITDDGAIMEIDLLEMITAWKSSVKNLRFQ